MATDINQSDKKFISQIKLSNNEVYDIATYHSITFKDGKGDNTEGVTWNGLTDLEIVIPNITDIVQSPIMFAGTVDGNGISWNTGYGPEAEVGNLLFIIDDCTFNGKACEAGDMAIYSGNGEKEGWKIVSGENQVSINDSLTDGGNGTKIASIGVDSATEVLDIEGKKLALKVDMSDIEGNLNKGGVEPVTLNGTVTTTVGEKYIKIVNDGTTTATGNCNVPLNDKKVTLVEGLKFVKSVTLPTISGGTSASGESNEMPIKCTVSGATLEKTERLNQSGDFVDSVGISLSLLGEDNKTDDSIKILNSFSLNPTTTNGSTFVTEIREKVNGESANFVTTTFDKTSYISSIDNYISNVTGGSLKYNDVDVDELLYGLGDEITDKTKGDVVYDVELSAPASVFTGASVVDGVLSFGSESMSIIPKYKSFTKATYTPVSSTPGTTPTTGTLTKKEYVYTTGHDTMTTYNISPTYKYLDIVENITYGKYGLGNIDVSIPKNAVVVNVKEGTLPTITGGQVDELTITDNVIGTVSSNLIGAATASVTVDKYKISNVQKSDKDTVTVGANGSTNINVNVNGNIDLSNYYCENTNN